MRTPKQGNELIALFRSSRAGREILFPRAGELRLLSPHFLRIKRPSGTPRRTVERRHLSCAFEPFDDVVEEDHVRAGLAADSSEVLPRRREDTKTKPQMYESR